MRLKTLILTAAVAMAIMAVSATPSGAAFGCRPDPRCDMPTPPPAGQTLCMVLWGGLLPTPIDIELYMPDKDFVGPLTDLQKEARCLIALDKIAKEYGYVFVFGQDGKYM